MPPMRPIGLLQCLYAAVFLAGVIKACDFITDGVILWPVLFLLIWPGIMMAGLFLIGSFVNRVPVSAHNLAMGFLGGELSLLIWMFWAFVTAICMALAPFFVAPGILFIVWLIWRLNRKETPEGQARNETENAKERAKQQAARLSHISNIQIRKSTIVIPEGPLSRQWENYCNRKFAELIPRRRFDTIISWLERNEPNRKATEEFVEKRFHFAWERLHDGR